MSVLNVKAIYPIVAETFQLNHKRQPHGDTSDPRQMMTEVLWDIIFWPQKSVVQWLKELVWDELHL